MPRITIVGAGTNEFMLRADHGSVPVTVAIHDILRPPKDATAAPSGTDPGLPQPVDLKPEDEPVNGPFIPGPIIVAALRNLHERGYATSGVKSIASSAIHPIGSSPADFRSASHVMIYHDSEMPLDLQQVATSFPWMSEGFPITIVVVKNNG
jgi:hypothetical protein